VNANQHKLAAENCLAAADRERFEKVKPDPLETHYYIARALTHAALAIADALNNQQA
jgi:hypothetical protein